MDDDDDDNDEVGEDTMEKHNLLSPWILVTPSKLGNLPKLDGVN